MAVQTRGVIVPGTHQAYNRVKEICHTGFTSTQSPNELLLINKFDLSSYLLSGQLHLGRYLFTTIELTDPDSWSLPFTHKHVYPESVDPKADGRTQHVYVYCHQSNNQYTAEDLLGRFDSVGKCQTEFGIPGSSLHWSAMHQTPWRPTKYYVSQVHRHPHDERRTRLSAYKRISNSTIHSISP